MTKPRLHTGLRLLASAGALALLAAGVLTAPGQTAAAAPDTGYGATTAPADYEGFVGQFNMFGSVGHYGQAEDIVWAIGSSVRDRGPLALALQEVCENQIEALADDLKGYGYVFEPAWAESADSADPDNGNREPARCRDVPGQEAKGEVPPRYGNAVLIQEGHGFSAQGDAGVGRFDLGSTNVTEYRSMVCTPSDELAMAVCSTHLTNGQDKEAETTREGEVQEAADRIRDNYDAGSVVLGADLNMEPNEASMSSLYHPDYYSTLLGPDAGQGYLRELMSECGNEMNFVCRGGASTFGAVHGGTGQRTAEPDRQYDYLFATPNVQVTDSRVTQPSQNCANPAHGVLREDVDPRLASNEFISCSDHEILWARISVNSP